MALNLPNLKKKITDLASRGYDQVNPFDAGLTAKQRTAIPEKAQRSVFGQATHNAVSNVVGGAIKAPIQFANSANLAARQVPEAVKMVSAQFTNNPTAGFNASQRADVNYNRFAPQNSGLFGQGTFFKSPQEAKRGDFKTVATRIGGGTLQTAATVLPVAKGASVATKGVSFLRAAPKLAAQGAGYGGAFSAGSQLVNNGRVDPRQTAIDAATGAVLGPATLGAGRVLAKGAKTASMASKDQALKVATRKAGIQNIPISKLTSYEGAPDKARVEHFKKQILAGRRPAAIIAMRDSSGKLGVEDGKHRLQAYKELGFSKIPGKITTPQQLKMATQGGYIGLPSGKPKVSLKQEPKISELGGVRPNNEIQTAIERAHNAGDNAAVAKLITQLPKADQPAMRSALGISNDIVPTQARKAPTTEVKLNTQRLNLNAGYRGMQELDKGTAETINKLSNTEVQQIAKSAGLDTKTYTVEQTKKKIAEQLNARRNVVNLHNEAEAARLRGDTDAAANLLKQASEQGRVSRTQGTDIARQLQARRILANELDTPQQRLFKLLDTAGVNPDEYTRRLAKVNLNDPKAVTKAFREMVPAKFGNWLDAVRYNSMLSSPLTHSVNAVSNALNVGVVAPIEKTLRGALDAAGGLFGKERQYAAGEGAAYAAGAVKSIRQAANSFLDVMTGKSDIQTLDLNEFSTPLAIGGLKGATATALTFPTRLLGASDKFFRTLATAGEEQALNLRQSKGIRLRGEKSVLAESEAAYRVYQREIGEKGQGKILEHVDDVANAILRLRQKSVVWKFVFPFVKTPTNILKQGIEFSPLGVANLAGNIDKTTALTRAAIGTAAFGTAAAMLDAGDITWGEPTNAEQKAAFRAEGKQPYSIRIGNKWISFVKLPPAVSFPFALTSGINDAVKTKKMDESTGEAIMGGVAKWGQFLSDQSYVKQIGDTLRAFKGDTESVGQAIANYPQQMIPLRALTGWLARMTDPYERKTNADKGYIDQQVQQLMLQYPGLRENVGTRENPFTGNPLEANNPVLNSFSPFRVTNDKGYGDTTGFTLEQRKTQGTLPSDQQQAYREKIGKEKNLADQEKKEREAFKKTKSTDIKKLSSGKFYTKVGDTYRKFDTQNDAQKALTRDAFDKSGVKSQVIDGTYYYKTKDGDVRTMSEAAYKARLNKPVKAQKQAGVSRGKARVGRKATPEQTAVTPRVANPRQYAISRNAGGGFSRSKISVKVGKRVAIKKARYAKKRIAINKTGSGKSKVALRRSKV